MANGKTIKERLAIVETELKNLITLQKETNRKIDKLGGVVNDLNLFKARLNGETKATARNISLLMSIIPITISLIVLFLRITGKF